jgi:1,3-beta-glucan synthase
MKQSKLRRRRVIRYAILYFVMLVVFVALLVGPSLARDAIPASLTNTFNNIGGFRLLQPHNQNRDNTNGTSATGTGDPDYTGAGLTLSSSADDSEPTNRIRLF